MRTSWAADGISTPSVPTWIASWDCAAHVALGGDWDGCDTIPALPSIDRIGDFYDYLLYHGYHETVVRNLFYNNLMRVVSER